MLSVRVRQSKHRELINYIEDIRRTAAEMEATDYPEVKAMQLEAIQFRISKAKALIAELC
jgi:hypothetical protein